MRDFMKGVSEGLVITVIIFVMIVILSILHDHYKVNKVNIIEPDIELEVNHED